MNPNPGFQLGIPGPTSFIPDTILSFIVEERGYGIVGLRFLKSCFLEE